jgi:hypothetical protein
MLATGSAGAIFQTGPQRGKMTAHRPFLIRTHHASRIIQVRRRGVPPSLLGETMAGTDAVRFAAVVQWSFLAHNAGETLPSTPGTDNRHLTILPSIKNSDSKKQA